MDIKELLKQNGLILQQSEELLQQLIHQSEELLQQLLQQNERLLKVEKKEKEECCICYEEYNKKERKKRRMRNCSHICCKECYIKIKKTKGYRVCMICRTSEKPK